MQRKYKDFKVYPIALKGIAYNFNSILIAKKQRASSYSLVLPAFTHIQKHRRPFWS